MKVRKRKSGWTGHTLRKEEPKKTCVATCVAREHVDRDQETTGVATQREAEMKETGLDWHSMVQMSRDTGKWRE